MAATKPDMLIDAVDDQNTVIGTVARSQVFSSKANFRTVHILVCVKSRIILQQLPRKHSRNPGRLGSSVAGYVFAGESYYEAAKRKLYNELLLDITLHDCGTFLMIDNNCKKFVKVYKSYLQNDHIEYNREEISRLRFWPQSYVGEALERFPNVFTPTFVEVYERAERS